MRNLQLLIVVVLVFVAGCKKECEVGYEGKGCNSETRINFYGVYSGVVTESGSTYQKSYTITYSSYGVRSFNIDHFTGTLEDKNGGFTIAPFSITDSYGNEIAIAEGTGNISSTQLNFIITVTSGSSPSFSFSGVKTN